MLPGADAADAYRILASRSIQPFGHNKHGPKSAGLCPLWGREDGYPSNNVAWAKAYQVVSWSIHLATTDMGRKLGACAPLGRGSWVPSNTMWRRGLRACQVSFWSIQPFGHNTPTLQTGQTEWQIWQTGQDTKDRQRSDSIGRPNTDLMCNLHSYEALDSIY